MAFEFFPLSSSIRVTATQFSDLRFPPYEGFTNQSFLFHGGAKRGGNLFAIELNCSFILENSDKPSEGWEVLRGHTKYLLSTNGELDEKQVYPVYEHSMGALINGIGKIGEMKGGIVPVTTRILSHEEVLPDLQKIVSLFYNDPSLS